MGKMLKFHYWIKICSGVITYKIIMACNILLICSILVIVMTMERHNTYKNNN